MDWDFSCPDWAERLQSGRSLIPALPLDRDKADRAVKIFNRLHLPDVPGLPTMEEAAGDWFRDIVAALFGSVDPITAARMVQQIFALVAKKNSKTTNGAALMLTALLVNERPRAEFLLVGPTQEIADTAFSQAEGMIEADETLSKIFQVQAHQKTIKNRRDKSFLKIKTFDMKVMTGSKPAGVLLDELHIMSGSSFASRVIGQIRGGMISNPEAFLVIITTQSDTVPAGCFKSELEYARAVRDGKITGGKTLPLLYEFAEELQTSEEKAWRDPKLWPMVLPNLGRSIQLDRLIKEYDEARDRGEEEERRWASQHLNIEIGLALHANRWRGADHWQAAGDKALTLDEILARSEVVTIGVDGGGLDDLLGLFVLGRDAETKAWLGWGHAWAHQSVFKLRKDIAERLRDFEKEGDLTVVDDLHDDVSDVADIVERVMTLGLLPEAAAVGLDPVGVAAIVDELAERKVDMDRMVGVPQGYRLSGVIKGAERKLADGKLRHGAQPLMAWCVSNAKSELRGSAMLITKQSSGSAKIDPLAALFNAFDLMSRNPVASVSDSVYESRGLLMA